MRTVERVVVRVGLAVAVMGLVILMPARPAAAHGQRAVLAFYGDFGPSATRCQRVIARAAAQCGSAVLEARTSCLNAQMQGQPCDTNSVDAAVQAAHVRAEEQIQGACTAQDAGILQFLSVEDAQRDVTNVCRDTETAAVSAAYGPALGIGAINAVDGTPRTCMLATASWVRRLVEFAASARQDAFDRIVSTGLSPSQKQALLDRSARRIAHARTLVQQRLQASCSAADFAATYGRSMDQFLDGVGQRGDCIAGAAYVQSTITCPQPVCGNGMQETAEECDDGNQYDADGCRNNCTKNNCVVFPSTFDLIQQAIFENHGCTNDLCHGSSRQGGLDLRKESAYASLVDTPSVASSLKRVEPGDEGRSLLWLKLAAATLGRTGVPGSPMPQNLPPLSAGELDAVRLWIYSGAPRTGVVSGTGELLNACLPPPEPLQIRPPEPPAAGTGVQLHMAPWNLQPNSESEVCFAAYYDFTDQVPAQFLSADGASFRFNRQVTTQDPLSHHLVTQYYHGQYPVDDPSWGSYVCVDGAHAGEPCDPLTSGMCGAGSECSTVPVKSIACLGFGPPDTQITISSLGFGGAQQPVSQVEYAPQVYAEIPLRGIIMWNSHAFNLTDKPGKMEAWVNFYFAAPADQVYPVHDVLALDKVFGMNVTAFTTQEVCNTYTMPPGAQVFSLSSHMHKRGKRFHIFRGAFRCASGMLSGEPCSPTSADACDGAACVDEGGRNGAESLIYTSLVYNDPVVLRFDTALDLSGADADRSFTYCGLYDNGFTNPAEVKRKSTSPPTPLGFPGLGGPCAVPTHCVAGKLRAPCSGQTPAARNASCNSSASAGDGFCDACPLVGGVTTEDEMFILLGSYFVR